MKNRLVFTGLLIAVLAIGILVIGCPTEGGGGGGGGGPSAGTSGTAVAKSVKIEKIEGFTGQAGVWVFAELPTGGNPHPTNAAIKAGYVSGKTLSVALTVPRDNTWSTSTPWTGSGDYYVGIVPIVNNQYQNTGWVYTNGGSSYVKVTFDKALTTLDFSKFQSVHY
jgi:hypothetical protein